MGVYSSAVPTYGPISSNASSTSRESSQSGASGSLSDDSEGSRVRPTAEFGDYVIPYSELRFDRKIGQGTNYYLMSLLNSLRGVWGSLSW